MTETGAELTAAVQRADRMAEMVIEKDREATEWAGWLREAEAAIVRVRALHSRDDSNPSGPWCGICLTAWPCQTIRALDEAPDNQG